MAQRVLSYFSRHLTRTILHVGLVLLAAAPGCSITSNLPAAQTTADFYQKYKDQSGFKGTNVPVGLVTRYLSREITDTTVRAALTNISSVRVLTFTPTSNKAQRLLERGLTQELDAVFQKQNYVAVPVLEDAGGSLQFKMRQTTNEQVQEIVGYQKRGNSFLMLQVNGRFTRQQVEQLLRKIDADLLLPLIS